MSDATLTPPRLVALRLVESGGVWWHRGRAQYVPLGNARQSALRWAVNVGFAAHGVPPTPRESNPVVLTRSGVEALRRASEEVSA